MELVWGCLLFAVLLLVSHLWFVIRVLSPIRKLALQAQELERGNFQALQQPCGGIEEIDTLRRSMAAMAGHVRRVQAQSQALTNGQEAERSRIARELHDDTVQSLIAIMQSMDIISNWVSREPQRAISLLKATREQAVESVNGLRRIIGALRPPALDELGLAAALRLQVEKFTAAPINIQIEGIERRLQDQQELALFRAAQESLNNITRHANAKQVNMILSYQDNGIRLSIHDDGMGFQVPQQLEMLALEGHYGLIGMHERIQGLKGTVSVTSTPGTTIEIFIPSAVTETGGTTVQDPVCSAMINPQQAYGSVEYQGKRYYFCCPVCQGAFQREPETYLHSR